MSDSQQTRSDSETVQQLVQQTAELLDREDLNAWLALFDENGRYEMASHSPELRRPQLWWNSEKRALSRILNEVPQHVRDPARRLHLVSAGVVTVDQGNAHVDSPFAIYRTTPEGISKLYAVGRYQDDLVRDAQGVWRYALHRAVLDTRVLDAFTHLPL
jgi:3-phenylpropionate/cinnamic acid dioxygenase small subunit